MKYENIVSAVYFLFPIAANATAGLMVVVRYLVKFDTGEGRL